MRDSLATRRTNVLAEAHARCRDEEGVPDGVRRLMLLGYLMAELEDLVALCEENLKRYGQITPGTEKAVRLRVRDLTRNVMGVPTSGSELPLAAD